MSLDTYLGIAGFALSLGNLASNLMPKAPRREPIIVVATTLVLLTGLNAWWSYQRTRKLNGAQSDIAALLKGQPRTIDHIRDDLLFDMTDITDAVRQGVADGSFRHYVRELPMGDGSTVRVRIYSVP
jgi:hypothetical protein